MAIAWTDKYRPKSLKEVAAQGRAEKEIRKWANEWKKGRPDNPALLFYGPPGTGKSATASALANDMEWDLVELNASDKRTRKEIERIAGTGATTGSLMGKGRRRLIVLDEADNVHGTADRGGYRAISKLISDTQNPIILIGNDRYAIPKSIRRKVKKVNFRRLRKDSIAKVLREIAAEEGVDVEPKALKALGERSNGDLRSAINDLQSAAEGRDKVILQDIVSLPRERKINIFKALGRLKKANDFRTSKEALWELDQNPEETIDWIEENIPKMLGNIPDLADAYDSLSRADIFLGRVRKKQAYGLWKYASDMMSAGVALSRKGKPGHGRYKYPSSRRVYGRTKKSRSKRDGVAAKIAEECHTSSREAIKNDMRYLAIIFQNDKEATKRIARQLELEEDEVKFLRKFA